MSEDQKTKSPLLRIILHPAAIAAFGAITAFVGWSAIHESKNEAPVYSYRESEYEITKMQSDIAGQIQKLQAQNEDLRNEVSGLNERLCAVEKKIGKKNSKRVANLNSSPGDLACKP